MTTIDYRPGTSGPFVARFEDDAGQAIDPSAAQVRVHVSAACLTVNGTLVDAGTWAFDLDGLDLAPRLYPASIYYDAGEGWRFGGAINLHIKGGC